MSASKRVYTPSDFARFAPSTAYDMLSQVPGFTIQNVDTSNRGLGQASENVLINGQRVANKTGAVDQLQRTPAATVERIEIVDAASLGIAGLSGQVANVILKQNSKASGQYEWDLDARPHFTKKELVGGSVSYSGTEGPVDYTLSVANGYSRGGEGGPVYIYDANHDLIEQRREVYHSEHEQVDSEAKFTVHGPGSSIGNLTLGYDPYWRPEHLSDTRIEADGERRSRNDLSSNNGYDADINGDYTFAMGAGHLKLIVFQHWEHNPWVQTDILNFLTSGASSQGSRFTNDTHSAETVTRAEYGWGTGRNDWQLSFERAFNWLSQKGGLFQLAPDGTFEPVAFLGGSGRVTELRYEALATFSRPLSSKLDLQIAAGAEISRLDLTSDPAPARKFFRPKGSVTLGWHPDKSWDISFKVRRRVGQISFGSFLAQAQLSAGRQEAENPELVPPQSWDAEVDFAHELGRWGKTSLQLHYYRVQDIVDFIPVGQDEQAVGNLPRADRAGFQSTSTINFDPFGWIGAKLDATFGAEWTSVRDPLTGRQRTISGTEDRWGELHLRHDIPHTKVAWGINVQYRHYVPNYYLSEIDQTSDATWNVGFGIQDKNVLGTTVTLNVDNILNGRHLEYRTVWAGWRTMTPIIYIERHNELIGPVFRLSIKGNF